MSMQPKDPIYLQPNKQLPEESHNQPSKTNEQMPPQKKGNDILTILHVSDLLFGEENENDGRLGRANKIAYNSLINTFKDNLSSLGDWKPDVVLISGNISRHGIAEEFNDCKRSFIIPLLSALHLDHSRIVICPGNRDIMLNNLGKYEYAYQHPQSEDDSIPKVDWNTICNSRYLHFEDYIKTFCKNDVRNTCRIVTMPGWEWLKIITMNSAWDCRKNEEEDRGRLRIGSSLVDDIINRLRDEKRGIIKAALLVNHPIGPIFYNPNDFVSNVSDSWYHYTEWPKDNNSNSVKDKVINNFHYSLNGHVDYEENISIDPIGKTVRLLGGKYKLKKGPGFGYLCRLIRIGKYSNTEFRNLITTTSTCDQNWIIGPPAAVSGEGDSLEKQCGDLFPFVINLDKSMTEGEYLKAVENFLRYMFSNPVIISNLPNYDSKDTLKEWLQEFILNIISNTGNDMGRSNKGNLTSTDDNTDNRDR